MEWCTLVLKFAVMFKSDIENSNEEIKTLTQQWIMLILASGMFNQIHGVIGDGDRLHPSSNDATTGARYQRPVAKLRLNEFVDQGNVAETRLRRKATDDDSATESVLRHELTVNSSENCTTYICVECTDFH